MAAPNPAIAAGIKGGTGLVGSIISGIQTGMSMRRARRESDRNYALAREQFHGGLTSSMEQAKAMGIHPSKVLGVGSASGAAGGAAEEKSMADAAKPGLMGMEQAANSVLTAAKARNLDAQTGEIEDPELARQMQLQTRLLQQQLDSGVVSIHEAVQRIKAGRYNIQVTRGLIDLQRQRLEQDEEHHVALMQELNQRFAHANREQEREDIRLEMEQADQELDRLRNEREEAIHRIELADAHHRISNRVPHLSEQQVQAILRLPAPAAFPAITAIITANNRRLSNTDRIAVREIQSILDGIHTGGSSR